MPHDWQVGDVAGEGGARKAVLSDERGAGEAGAPSIQQTVQAIEFV